VFAEPIRRAVQALTACLPDRTSLGVTVSAGVSALEHAGEAAELIAAADAALYEAERSGKNRTCRAAQRLQYGST
jgi:diguanylate cyclase (GGDEF)-like protein